MSDYRIISVREDRPPSIIAKPRTRQECEDKLRDLIIDKGFSPMYSEGSDRYDLDLDVHYVGYPTFDKTANYRIVCVHEDRPPSIIAKPRTRRGCEDKLCDLLVNKGLLPMYSEGSDRYDLDLDVHYVGDSALAEIANREHIVFGIYEGIMEVWDWATFREAGDLSIYLEKFRGEYGPRVLGDCPHFHDGGYRIEYVLYPTQRICHNCAFFIDVDTTCPRYRGRGPYCAKEAADGCPDYYFCPNRKEAIE